jgi:hypothetical protein
MPAAQGIYGNNTLPLIFLSGINYDIDDSAITNCRMGTKLNFDVNNIAGGYGNKLLFEIHNYQVASCDDMTSGLTKYAYGAMDQSNSDFSNLAPVVMSEFGFNMNDGSSEQIYAQCLKNFLPNQVPGGPGGWMQWDVSGSYYIRSGNQDVDENHS